MTQWDCKAAAPSLRAKRSNPEIAMTKWGFSLDCFTALQFAMTFFLDCRAASGSQ
jgi:hypothetical protein